MLQPEDGPQGDIVQHMIPKTCGFQHQLAPEAGVIVLEDPATPGFMKEFTNGKISFLRHISS